jgi:hypothetical protein
MGRAGGPGSGFSGRLEPSGSKVECADTMTITKAKEREALLRTLQARFES